MSITFDVFRGNEDGKIVVGHSTRELEPTQVFVRITHSGLCGTDLHYLGTGQVLGHEGIGIVEQVGRDVETPRVGDRVGLGYLHKICGTCKNCLTGLFSPRDPLSVLTKLAAEPFVRAGADYMSGLDIYCERKKQYGSPDPDVGSIASGMVFEANCTIPIPDEIASEDAAPLLCAGATVFTPLLKYGVNSTDRVGVLGVGGLGHLAIKLAAAMGCHVVVLSSSDSKREEATAFGAKEFHAMKDWDGKKPDGWKGLDHLLVCGSGKPDYLLWVSRFRCPSFPCYESA